MADAESDIKLEREDTNLSEDPSAAGTTQKKNKSRKSSPTGSQPKTPESRPKSSSSDAFTDGKKKKKLAPVPPGSHRVTFTVTIAKAIPNASDDDGSQGGDMARKKKRIVEAPRAQNHYHCEYYLLPEDDDPVKTDVVTFGMAAKIYTERQEPKVLKTWQNGDQSWVAWTHCHPVIISDEVLMKLFNHKLEMRIWDTRDKLSTRAKFDRPKAFRLPQPKPGEDADNVGGVKTLVMKQSRSYESMQPKRSYINRPLPSQIKVAEKEAMMSLEVTDRFRTEKLQNKKGSKKPGTSMEKDSISETNRGGAASVPQPTVQPPTQDGQPLKSYGHLVGLVGKDPIEEGGESLPDGGGRGRSDSVSRSKQKDTLPALPPRGDLHMPPRTGDSDSTLGRSPGKGNSKFRRNKKAEAAAQALAEQTKKNGIACVSIRMATLFAGVQTVTNRLDKPVSTLDDVFVTVSLNGPLMSEQQKQKLNPLIIKVHSARQMPDTPIPYADLRLRCMPAYVRYRFFNEPEYSSCGREQDESIYWDDINVVLTGVMDRSELLEYINGPPLDIEVHDRDRVIEKQKLKPTLFGDDLEDQKISNVGTVTSKRTLHNPYSSRDRPWDPYGVSKFDLSGLLLGQKVLYLESPIHSCSSPDILGTRGKSADGKLVGVAGATDGPVDSPLPVGHYLEANSMLKIKVEIAHPLIAPQAVGSKEEVQTSEKCPFSRIIFMFAYKNTKTLHNLQGLIMDVNARALHLSEMPQHVIEAALSTYKLSLEQQQSRTLDIITGFQVLDGTQHIFVLEGLKEGAVNDLWTTINKDKDNDITVLYNSGLSFHERLYGPLDVDLCRVKLHEPLSVIMQQPLLYVRDMVPQPCFNALSKLNQVTLMTKMRDVVRNDLFPSADMVISMSREFGVPLSTEDFEELQHDGERVSESPVAFVEPTRTSREWTPIDNYNPEFIEQMQVRDGSGESRDYITENKIEVKKISNDNKVERAKTSPAKIRAETNHNYSTQTLNSTNEAKEKLRRILAEDPDRRYTYCPEYHHSMTVVPVNVEALAKEAHEKSVDRWRTPAGWIFPGKKTSLESNKHIKRPDPARIDEVHTDWEENILHANVLEPTLAREGYQWEDRKNDFDVWTKPNPVFGADEPATIHLAGTRLKNEKLAALTEEQKEWKSKVIVRDTEMNFHRCLPETESRWTGFKSSNQLDRLKGLLKDEPNKLYLRNARATLGEIPPLNVVLNPSVDQAAREAGLPILPAVTRDEKPISGFFPGPFTEHSWVLERNKIPVYDYNHQKFAETKGHDFRLYHKPRSSLHNRKIQPLADKEYQSQLFRWPAEKRDVPPYIIPDIKEFKHAFGVNGIIEKNVQVVSTKAKPQKVVETN